MAAVLCKAIFTPCKYMAKGCDKVCTECGKCCDECCKCFTECTDGCCKCLAKNCECCCGCLENGMDGFCQALGSFFDKPFSCCVAMTVLLNLGAFGALVAYLATGWATDCENPLHIWLIVSLVLFIANLIFGFYLFNRLSNVADDEIRREGRSAFQVEWDRAYNFFMNDLWVALYIIIIIFEFAWGIVGLKWSEQSAVAGCDDIMKATQTGSFIVIAFVASGLFCIFFTLCTSALAQLFEECPILKCACCCLWFPCIEPMNQRAARIEHQRVERLNQRGNRADSGSSQHLAPGVVVQAVPVQQEQIVLQVAQPLPSPSAPSPYPQQQVYQAPQAYQQQHVGPPAYQQQASAPQQQQQQFAQAQPVQQQQQFAQAHPVQAQPVGQAYAAGGGSRRESKTLTDTATDTAKQAAKAGTDLAKKGFGAAKKFFK